MKLSVWKLALVITFTALIACASVAAQSKENKENSEGSNGGTQVERITVDELKQILARNEPVTIIDVRGKDYDTSPTRIKGAIRVPPSELASHLKKIPQDHLVVTYCACATDGGAVKAAEAMLANGFKQVRALKGGWNAWTQAGGPVEPK